MSISIEKLDMNDAQKAFVKEVESDYMYLVSEITSDFGDVLVMLKGRLINTDMYNRLHPLINKYKLSFGMSYYRGDNRLMLRHFKTGPISFSSRELWNIQNFGYPVVHNLSTFEQYEYSLDRRGKVIDLVD